MEMNIMSNESIIQSALCTVQSTNDNLNVKNKLEELTSKITTLDNLICNYTVIQQDDLSSDDEIIGWTLPVVKDELNSATWNLASGFYKTAATCLRGALEMGLVALYFQMLENENTIEGEYNQAFADWDRGETDTPNWREMEPVFKRHMNTNDFNISFGYCPIHEVGQYIQLLDRFAHNCSFSSISGEGTNIMNMTSGVSGHFSQEIFDRMYKAVDSTISIIASTWITIFPHILSELDSKLAETVKSLFVLEPAKDAYEFAIHKNTK
jgi:hypothetical protein